MLIHQIGRPVFKVWDPLGNLASEGLTGDSRIGLGRIRLERLLGCGQNEVRCEISSGRKHVAGRDLPTSVLDFWKDMLIEYDRVMNWINSRGIFRSKSLILSAVVAPDIYSCLCTPAHVFPLIALASFSMIPRRHGPFARP